MSRDIRIGNLYLIRVPRNEWDKSPMWGPSLEKSYSGKVVKIIPNSNKHIRVQILGRISEVDTVLVRENWLDPLCDQLEFNFKFE